MRAAPDHPVVVPLSPTHSDEGTAFPVVLCPHAVSGSASVYGLLAAKWKNAFSVIALQSAGLTQGAAPHESVEEMAEAYLASLKSEWLPESVGLFGWSMGGVVAYEMARRLRLRGHGVRLVMADSEFPEPFAAQPSPAECVEWFAEDTLGSLGLALGTWPPGLSVDASLAHLLQRLGLAEGTPPPDLLDDFRRRFRVFRQNLRAATGYRPAPLDADVLMIRAADDAAPLSRWRQVVRGTLTDQVVPGDHYGILTAGTVDTVADLARAHLTGRATPPGAERPADGGAFAHPGAAASAAADAAFLELQTPVGLRDPYPCYDRLRATAPVYRTSYGQVLVTGYTEAGQALRSGDLAVEDAAWMDVHDPQWRSSPTSVVMGESLLHRNPPDHTRLRRLVNGAFVQRRVQALAGRIEGLVTERLDALEERGAGGATVDLHEVLAYPLPVAVIGEMLGVPPADWEWLRGSTAAVSVVFDIFTSDDDYARSDAAIRTLTPYFESLVEERRKAPRNDMISALLASHDGEGTLSGDELLQIILLLFIAGFETTVNLLTNGVTALLRHPDQLALLRSDPGLTGAAVEETLRFQSPVQATIRHAVQDTEIGGVPVAKSAPVVVFMGAANRDPAHFETPERFRIDRVGPKNMTFGGGIHYCLGASLARLEASIVFRALFRRFPGLALAGEPELRPIFNLRGYSTLPVTIG